MNDTDHAHIRVFDVKGDGSLRTAASLPRHRHGEPREEDLVDGMKLDERGNIWVTGPGGIWVIGPDGDHLGSIEIPEPVGNLHWGGPDWQPHVRLRSTGLYRIRTKPRHGASRS